MVGKHADKMDGHLYGFIAAARGGRETQHTELALLFLHLLHGHDHIRVSLGSVALIHHQAHNLLAWTNACTPQNHSRRYLCGRCKELVIKPEQTPCATRLYSTLWTTLLPGARCNKVLIATG